MDPASETSAGVAFGRFLVLPHRRELLADSQPIKLGGRAFDVLMALIEARGAVLSKDALMTRVWPDRIVEENALQGQISALRMALGADRDLVRTVSGRGYQFIGEVRPVSSANENAGAVAVATKPASAVPMTNLPEPVSELIGRDDEIGEILNLTAAHRLVTLTGAGGIGKTRIALALARELLPHFADGVWLAELSPLTDPSLVTATVAFALGLEPAGGEISIQRVAQMLTGRRLLLVLDTCEHVIDAAAALVEAVQRAGSMVHILATSREPLQVEGEWIYPVPPLAVPAENANDQDDPLQYGAVRLFIERARAAEPHFAPDRRNAASMALICRQLDGIPLAIELAASRVAMLGIEELATRLEDRLQLLTSGRRTALPRHRTLRATLDWSYDLLAEPERILLRRLAIFVGPFSLEATCAVAAGPELAASDVLDVISSLLTKSLVTMAIGGGMSRYRLLDTTRAYAIEKLDESSERDRIARGHAEYYRRLFERAEGEAPARPADEWLADYAREIDNVRAALDWSFSPAGDSAVGIDLTAAYAPVWLNLSLMVECRERCECALLGFERGVTPNPQTQMWLQIALGTSLIDTMGHVEQARALLTEALETADMLDDLDAQARALTGLMTASLYHGLHGRSRTAVKRFGEIAERLGDPAVTLAAYRLMATMLLTIGRFPEAQHALGRVLQSRDPPQNRGRAPWYTTGHRASDRAMLSRALWLRGFVEKAHHEAQASLDELGPADPQLLICRVLYVGICRLAPMTGDFAAAEQANARLIEVATSLNAQRWQTVGRFLEGKLLVERRDFATGLAALRDAFETCRQTGWLLSYPEYKCWLAEALAGLGQLDEALDAVREGLEGSAQGEEGQRWYVPELLRIKGEVLLQQAVDRSVSLAENCFAQAGEVAREQGALFWELRVALSVARLRMTQGRNKEARQVLAPVYERFTEGFGTADMLSARQLLESLS